MDNRQRIFADLVSIDAWHPSFEQDGSTIPLHIDASFSTARVGGETASPVRFRLSLKCAEIVVVIPPTEPVTIDRASVVREEASVIGTKELKITDSTAGHGNFNAGLSTRSGSTFAEAGVGIDRGHSVETELKLQEQISHFHVQCSKTLEGHYRWFVRSSTAKYLTGRPWDSTVPRLTLIDQRKNRSDIAPSVRVEIRCRKEDLLISDIETKNRKFISSENLAHNKKLAAEAYIRTKLQEFGLLVNALDDPFSEIILASISAADN